MITLARQLGATLLLLAGATFAAAPAHAVPSTSITFTASPTAKIGEYTFSPVFHTPVVRSVHGDSSGVRGAAWLWRD